MTTPDSDIIIVGGGLSGTIAASALGRAGYRVTLIDRNETFPPEFRVEKMGGEQLVKLERLGLLPALAANASSFEDITSARHGRVLDRMRMPFHGILYHELVGTMRRELSDNVRFIAGRVTDLSTSDDEQTVTIAEHGIIRGRLLVLASGMSDILRSRLGIEREVLHERQSLTFGFDLAPHAGNSFPFQSLTYYGERPADGIDYITIFPTRQGLRANLFAFLDHRDPWVKAMRTSPTETLAATLPGLTRLAGPLEIVSKVQSWIMDIGVARNVRQAGVVLIGDAYQTSCPAAGTGTTRLLTDIEALVGLVPGWFATPGMSAAKIGGYYDDATKQATDAYALGMADYRRSITIDTSLGWRTRRQTQYLRRAVLHNVERVSPRLAAQIRALRQRSSRA